MAINYSGTLSMGNATAGQSIRLEEGGPTTDISLRSLSSVAGKATPDAMSEFYGYVHKRVTFSSSYSGSGTSGTTGFSGTVTIIGTAATFRAYAQVYSGGPVSVSISIGTNNRSVTRTGIGTSYSSTFTLSPGSYAYSGSFTITGGFCSGGITYTQ